MASQERIKAVQALRKIAKRYSVPRVEDNASRDKVKAMYEALKSTDSVNDSDMTEAEASWRSYCETWPDFSQQAGQEGGEAENEQRWKFKAAQLTYNQTIGDWASRDASVLKALFGRLVIFLKAALAAYNPEGISVTLEDSIHSSPPHVHAHAYFHLSKEFRSSSLTVFAFEGIRPHVVANRARGNAFEGAVRRGHYYVVVPKIGSLHEWTDYHPFRDYAVEGWWIDNWLKSGKLDREAYLKIAAQITVGFPKRLGDVRAAERFEKEAAVKQHVEAELQGLGDLLPMKDFPQVEVFLSYFRAGHHRRRPILAIVGGTNLGKSLLGIQILKKICELLNVPTYLEITVEGNDFLDFSDYDHRSHAGVLLDGVGDALVLKANRELLQGRPKIAKGGQSGTMIYSYPFTLCKRAVIATFDLAAQNLDALVNEKHS